MAEETTKGTMKKEVKEVKVEKPAPEKKKEAPQKKEVVAEKKEVVSKMESAPKEITKKEEKPVKKEEPKPKPKKKEKSYKIIRSKESSKLAREKSRLEKKKGKFKRQNYGKKLRIPDRWRRPKGIDSGHQNDEKYKPAHPRSGYMTPQKVKGLDVTGYEPVRVFNVDGLEGLDSKTQAILIASCVGKKKRTQMQKIAQEKRIAILNYKE